MSESTCLRHGPCEKCGSRDNCGIYDDGHRYCFGCSTYFAPDSDHEEEPISTERETIPLLTDLEFGPLSKRGLTLETVTKWGYGYKHGVRVSKLPDTRSVQVAQYWKGRKVVAQHIRCVDDDGNKTFRWLGEHREASLFGMHLWPNPGGKMVVLTEGEIDAMSVSQLQGHKYPVLSIPNGASNAVKDVGKVIEYLEAFDRVVILFDNDEPGQKAAVEVAQVLSPGKASIAKLPLKDASDMLVAGQGKELVNAIWRAFDHPYRPDEILSGAALWDAITQAETGQLLPFPHEGLNAKMAGLRTGQILTIVAGTGVGKSTWARDVARYWHDEHNEAVGLICLEETLTEVTCEIIGPTIGKREIDGVLLADLPKDQLKPYFDRVMDERWQVFNHMGCVDFKVLEHRIRYFAKVCGCTTIVFDHLLAAVEGGDDATNDAVSRTMSRLRSLVGELGIRLVMPTHVKSVEGRAFEEGATIRLIDIKWPAIRQYSNKIISLERDQQGKDQTTFGIRVLKCRGERGQLGFAGEAKWDPKTGRITEVQQVPDVEMFDDESAKEEATDEDAPF